MSDSKIENKYFKKAKRKASSILQNRDKLNHLLQISKDKLSDVNNIKLVDNIKIFARMIKAYSKGTYKDVPVKGILAIIAAIVYFAMPIDLIPDLIPVTGMIDDFAVVMWVYNQLQTEIEAFRVWESEVRETNG
ncbi:MAG: YkvA family protein [Cyclobacteriaceae bacterium]|nr:YkvA family protein [Cyclobacteriaceae bacterium]